MRGEFYGIEDVELTPAHADTATNAD